MSPVVLVVWLVLAYLAVGAAVALPFVLHGVRRVDPVARGASVWVRLLFWPGASALWPIMLMRWVRAGGPADSAHEQSHSEGAPDGA